MTREHDDDLDRLLATGLDDAAARIDVAGGDLERVRVRARRRGHLQAVGATVAGLGLIMAAVFGMQLLAPLGGTADPVSPPTPAPASTGAPTPASTGPSVRPSDPPTAPASQDPAGTEGLTPPATESAPPEGVVSLAAGLGPALDDAGVAAVPTGSLFLGIGQPEMTEEPAIVIATADDVVGHLRGAQLVGVGDAWDVFGTHPSRPGPVTIDLADGRRVTVAPGTVEEVPAGARPLASGHVLTWDGPLEYADITITDRGGDEVATFASGSVWMVGPGGTTVSWWDREFADQVTGDGQATAWSPDTGVVALPDDCMASDRIGTNWVLMCPEGGDGWLPTTVATWDGTAAPQVAANVPTHPPMRSIGYWRSATASPDGTLLGMTHSGECEVVSMTLIGLEPDGPSPFQGAPGSRFLGWGSDGTALEAYAPGPCSEGAGPALLSSRAKDGSSTAVLDVDTHRVTGAVELG